MKQITNAITVFLSIILMIGCIASNKIFANTFQQIKSDTMQTGKYAEVNGIKMYYEIHGEGKPLVLIHGGGSTIQTSFGNTLPLFAKNFKVIAVELQAHGHTGDRDAPETFQQDAEDVAALLKLLNIAKTSVLGFSNGGTTTLQIAVRYPEMIDKIVVIAGAYKREGFIPGFFEGMEHATIENMPQGLQEAFLTINPDTAALLNMFNKDKNRMIHFTDWPDSDLQSIKSPALIINADKDVTTTAHALQMSKLIPDCELMILPGLHGECLGVAETAGAGSKIPALTVAVITDFLNK